MTPKGRELADIVNKIVDKTESWSSEDN
ncbi:hypothetical protein [Shewanella sp. cp20]|nr:hypothetical protein [Shewanella sp. cp20]